MSTTQQGVTVARSESVSTHTTPRPAAAQAVAALLRRAGGGDVGPLPVIIGRIADGFFEVVSREDEVAPDPYLSRYDPARTFGRPRLRVVS